MVPAVPHLGELDMGLKPEPAASEAEALTSEELDAALSPHGTRMRRRLVAQARRCLDAEKGEAGE